MSDSAPGALGEAVVQNPVVPNVRECFDDRREPAAMQTPQLTEMHRVRLPLAQTARRTWPRASHY